MSVAGAVRNVIFDLGGVVFELESGSIVSRVQPVPELRAALKEALFGHPDWRCSIAAPSLNLS